ncbi:MAG: PEGA domain-containing protein [Opitutaceae bacterium]|jgi:hypothetical protein|nr:PEGA domain-containing protein [Opitutaceae bacterium]
MHLPRLLVALAATAALALPGFAQTSPAPAPEAAAPARAYQAAIVVSNRADAQYDDKVSALEDLLSARLADLGFQLISRELVTSNLRAFVPPGAPADADSARAAAAAEAAFLDQSSAVRLAQNLGADYLLHASITSYGSNQRNVTAYGNTLTNHDYTLRVAYKVLDARAGGALTGDVVEARRTEQANANATATLGTLFDDLLADASRQITSSLRTRRDAGRIAAASPAPKSVTITLNLEAADLYIPDVRVNNENVVTVGESKFKVTPLAATVEVDGIAVGTAPGKLTLRPGFSRLRVSREGWQTWERTINASEGQTLNVALSMTPEGLARFRESTAFLNNLKNEAKLTDAEVKVLEGQAKSLENSFFRVDTKENFRFILPERYREVN